MMNASSPPAAPEPAAAPWRGWRRLLLGRPRDPRDPSVFGRLLLVPFLAWVGLGADGLSSSAYGPEAAFRTLGDHTYLAVAMAAAMALTIFVLSTAYSRIIEAFPFGGGGYVVSTKLIGPAAGVVAGCALLIDYALTITVSVAAAGDALFSLLPAPYHGAKLTIEVLMLLGLTVLNLRGVRESVLALTPVFLLFVLTHLWLIAAAIAGHGWELLGLPAKLAVDFQGGVAALGGGGLALLFLHAYSLGGGTYTGIEAVSNSLPVLAEPRAQTGKRAMLYMAISLAFTAAGLIVAYLLVDVKPMPGRTMNAVLAEAVGGSFAPADIPVGAWFVALTLLSESALLLVAAQTGMIDGPRVMSNMALDSWLPHRFSSLSERLTTQNGIVVMAAGSLAALLALGGDVQALVIMYSINVFITFLLSMVGMCRRSLRERARGARNGGTLALFLFGGLLCAVILVITVFEKFLLGGWLTLVITGSLVTLCFVIRSHYRRVASSLAALNAALVDIPAAGPPASGPPDPSKPTAAILVTSFSGLGVHTILNTFRYFPNYFRSLVFVSVGVVDSGNFKGADAVAHLEEETRHTLSRYEEFARRLGMPTASFFAVGTDPVEEAERIGLEVAGRFPHVTFFAGQIIFHRPTWYDRWLHNETAFAIQRRLQWHGLPVVILPVRLVS